MGLRTSVYLTDELEAAWKASGVPLGELVRRGLAERAVEDEAAWRAAEAVASRVEAALGAVRAEITKDVLEEVRQVAREIIEGAVREALRQGGGGY